MQEYEEVSTISPTLTNLSKASWVENIASAQDTDRWYAVCDEWGKPASLNAISIRCSNIFSKHFEMTEVRVIPL
jgi:hypothetical protein